MVLNKLTDIIRIIIYEIFILSPFTSFFREAGSLVSNQVVTTELYSQIILHPEERQRPFRMGYVIIDGTPVYAKETRCFVH